MFHLVKVPGVPSPPMLLNKDQYLARELQDRTVIPINAPNFDDVEVEGQKPAASKNSNPRGFPWKKKWCGNMEVSENGGTPKSSKITPF